MLLHETYRGIPTRFQNTNKAANTRTRITFIVQAHTPCSYLLSYKHHRHISILHCLSIYHRIRPSRQVGIIHLIGTLAVLAKISTIQAHDLIMSDNGLPFVILRNREHSAHSQSNCCKKSCCIGWRNDGWPRVWVAIDVADCRPLPLAASYLPSAESRKKI